MKKRLKPHHFKLAGLFASKLFLAFFAFVIGTVVGSIVGDVFIGLLIAVVVAALIYLLSVLHIIDWLEI